MCLKSVPVFNGTVTAVLGRVALIPCNGGDLIAKGENVTFTFWREDGFPLSRPSTAQIGGMLVIDPMMWSHAGTYGCAAMRTSNGATTELFYSSVEVKVKPPKDRLIGFTVTLWGKVSNSALTTSFLSCNSEYPSGPMTVRTIRVVQRLDGRPLNTVGNVSRKETRSWTNLTFNRDSSPCAMSGTYICLARDAFGNVAYGMADLSTPNGTLTPKTQPSLPRNGVVSPAGTCAAVGGCAPGTRSNSKWWITSTRNGTWASHNPTTCVQSSCNKLSHPAHGSVSVNGLAYGSVAYYSCSSGFVLSGSRRRFCNKYQRWINGKPVCLPDVCSRGRSTCSKNGHCVADRSTSGFQCVCNVGYFGNGFECRENKCVTGTHECDINAKCSLSTSVDGYSCKCAPGFLGNGTSCKLAPVVNRYVRVNAPISLDCYDSSKVPEASRKQLEVKWDRQSMPLLSSVTYSAGSQLFIFAAMRSDSDKYSCSVFYDGVLVYRRYFNVSVVDCSNIALKATGPTDSLQSCAQNCTAWRADAMPVSPFTEKEYACLVTDAEASRNLPQWTGFKLKLKNENEKSASGSKCVAFFKGGYLRAPCSGRSRLECLCQSKPPPHRPTRKNATVNVTMTVTRTLTWAVITCNATFANGVNPSDTLVFLRRREGSPLPIEVQDGKYRGFLSPVFHLRSAKFH